MPPTYGMYAVLANINGVGIKEVPLTADFQLEPEKILAAVDSNTKAIFFAAQTIQVGTCLNPQP